MFGRIKEFFAKVSWIKAGRPEVTYLGFNCGCCGVWCPISFSIPKYKSCGEWWDTWGLCPECIKEK